MIRDEASKARYFDVLCPFMKRRSWEIFFVSEYGGLMINRRSYLEKLEMYTNRNVVKILVGVRRSGKTTLLKSFIEELKASGVPETNIIYLNFESAVYAFYNDAVHLRDTLNDFINATSGHVYIFLDEAQTIDRWDVVCAEMMNLFDCDIYVAASNSSLLKNDFGKTLDYRFVRIDIFPFSFTEYLDIVSYDMDLDEATDDETSYDASPTQNSSVSAADTADSTNYSAVSGSEGAGKRDGVSNKKTLSDHFFDYLSRGAMPGVYSIHDEETSRDYIRGVYNTIILKDVVQANNLREIGHIDKIMEYVTGHVGETYSPKAIKDYCVSNGAVISVDTVYVCLEALTGAFLLNKVPRYDIRGERKLETQEKYYLCDPAMIVAIRPSEKPKIKAQLENVLCNELLSRGFGLYVGKSGRQVVDFMGVRGEDRTYLNVYESIAHKADEKKAFTPLLRIRDNYFKMVLSLDPKTIINKGGIINYPLINFLIDR